MIHFFKFIANLESSLEFIPVDFFLIGGVGLLIIGFTNIKSTTSHFVDVICIGSIITGFINTAMAIIAFFIAASHPTKMNIHAALGYDFTVLSDFSAPLFGINLGIWVMVFLIGLMYKD